MIQEGWRKLKHSLIHMHSNWPHKSMNHATGRSRERLYLGNTGCIRVICSVVGVIKAGKLIISHWEISGILLL